MIVKELIELLNKYPKDMKVGIKGYYDEIITYDDDGWLEMCSEEREIIQNIEPNLEIIDDTLYIVGTEEE